MSDAIILGAGPTGLAAAWRLAREGRSARVIERDARAGGLCRGSELAGCRFDIGPHVFKARSAEVAELWDSLCEGRYEPERSEHSPLLFRGELYPSKRAIALDLPLGEQMRIALDLVRSALPRRRGRAISSEDWLRQVRGTKLLDLIYRSREEKLWGRPLCQIDPAWYAAQSHSFPTRLRASLESWLPSLRAGRDASANDTGSDRNFPYRPRHPVGGAGLVYARLAERLAAGCHTELMLGHEFIGLEHMPSGGWRVRTRAREDGHEQIFEAASVISSVPIQKLLRALDPPPPASIAREAERLAHRDLVVVNLVVSGERAFPYDLVHPQTDEVRSLRISNLGNLSPALRNAAGDHPLCIEYNAFAGDPLWSQSDEAIIALALDELERIALVERREVVDAAVERVREAYPIHALGYRQAANALQHFVRSQPGLQSVGRNGLFTYNQMSHSVECGLLAAENTMGAEHALDVPPIFDLPF